MLGEPICGEAPEPERVLYCCDEPTLQIPVDVMAVVVYHGHLSTARMHVDKQLRWVGRSCDAAVPKVAAAVSAWFCLFVCLVGWLVYGSIFLTPPSGQTLALSVNLSTSLCPLGFVYCCKAVSLEVLWSSPVDIDTSMSFCVHSKSCCYFFGDETGSFLIISDKGSCFVNFKSNNVSDDVYYRSADWLLLCGTSCVN